MLNNQLVQKQHIAFLPVKGHSFLPRDPSVVFNESVVNFFPISVRSVSRVLPPVGQVRALEIWVVHKIRAMTNNDLVEPKTLATPWMGNKRRQIIPVKQVPPFPFPFVFISFQIVLDFGTVFRLKLHLPCLISFPLIFAFSIGKVMPVTNTFSFAFFNKALIEFRQNLAVVAYGCLTSPKRFLKAAHCEYFRIIHTVAHFVVRFDVYLLRIQRTYTATFSTISYRGVMPPTYA